ncbi:MAG: xanthine dehydrogenase family protein subunit M [Syntrophorhabdaceae bacterium]|nr:xanthine dehydrogenase family protein subunit M [Syntrophorhabdaceae bacterium]
MFIRRLPKFEYHAPESIEGAINLKLTYGEDGRYIAGGTDLLIAMKKREVTPHHLISLSNIDTLKGISMADDGGIRIGAMTTLGEIERSELVKRYATPLWDAVDVMASTQIRHLATIGGNLCSAVPSADSAPPLIALRAFLKILGPSGEKTVPVENFFKGPKETVLNGEEILTSILIPKVDENSGGCYRKLMRRKAMDLAIVGVAAWIKLDQEKKRCIDARVALGAVAPTPIRVEEVEKRLIGSIIDETSIGEAAKIAGTQCRPITDIRASAEYRCSMVEVFTKRAVLGAMDRIMAG